MVRWEWGVGECGIIYLDFIVSVQPETIEVGERHNIGTAKTIRTFLIAETVNFIANCFFRLASSFWYICEETGLMRQRA
ncbi:hypothetical protein Q5692_21795 [Microcoleus sp. C2C3]|uniref:hypothetical protein n=1 Tax=unclassified Microcoleus TaxID=2642155 RepID=UPI002FD4D638